MLKKTVTAVGLLLVASIAAGLFLVGCSGGKSYEWPKSGLARLIDKPNTDKGEIKSNSDTMFMMDVYEYEQSDYEKYIDSCKKRGFNIDVDFDGLPFKAFNKNGYELSVNYVDGAKEMSITLEKLMETGKIKWPEMGLATLLPVVKSDKGKIIDDNSESFYAYFADMDKNAYLDYIDACIKKGFKKDYSKGDIYYRAKDGKNHKIEIMYKGFNRISVYVALEKEKKKNTKSDSDSVVDSNSEKTGAENESVVKKSSILKVETDNPKEKQKLKKLVGKTVYKAKKKVKKLNYKAKYFYDFPNKDLKEDYTDYVGYTSKKDLKLMFVTRVEKINTSSKTVTIYINDKNPAKNQKSNGALSWETVCSAVEEYGQKQYSGFDLHETFGLIADEKYDDGSYMIKAECTLRNAYGKKQKSICEAKVAGTDDNPKVTCFFVYDE